MSFDYKAKAELCAERIDAAEFGMDPITIVTIITQVLPLLADCFNRNDSPDPVEAAERLREYNRKNPQGLRKRMARRIRAEATKPMTKEQSFTLADAIIQETIQSSDEVIFGAVAGASEAVQ